MADARKDRRTLLSLKIRYKSATLEDFIERYSNDISRGGVFIKTKKPLAVGTLLKFEFLLHDESMLIHGVGRVAWRREESESDPDNPAGMGIKFIKMDPESRSIVQQIVEDRPRPGVFDQGKEGTRAGEAFASDPSGLASDDQTKVQHVSEFLASALEEGGAAATTRGVWSGAAGSAPQGGRVERPAARGAFGAAREPSRQRGHSVSDAPARGAMSAFGGSGASMSAGRHSSAAPAFDPMEADDDFLDEETTKVKELPVSDFPDAAATVVSKDVSPFVRERQLTPVVPAVAPSRSPLEDAVPDLFDEDDVDDIDTSADDMIDPRLLDPAAAAVPPPAGGVSDAGPVAAAVFDVPKAAPAVEDPIRVSRKKKTRGWLAVLLLMLLVFAAAVAALRLGLLDDVLDRWLPELSLPESLAAVPSLGAAAVQVTPGADVAVPTGSDEAPQAPSATPAAAQDAPVEAQPEAAQPITADMIALRVLSVPSGAFVSINGKAAGRTPLVVEHAAGTELSIFSKARGFLARREKIVVQAGQDALKLVLSPLPFVIEVVTDPPGANITVAGVGSAITPAKVELTSFTQSLDVEISKPGHETVRKSVARKSFIEEPRRMVAKINAKLTPVGTPAQAQAPAAEEPVAEAAPETAEAAEPPATEIPADAAP